MQKESNNRILRYVAIILTAIILVTSILIVINVIERRQSIFTGEQPEANSAELIYKGKTYIKKDNIETMLVLGLDKLQDTDEEIASYNNDKQADFIMLFVIDNENSTCNAIHINRDTMTRINVLGVAGNKVGTVNKQIALSHTYGNGKEVSCRNAADAVSGLLLGAKVNHFASVTMDAVPVFNDLVGGVELEVLDDFSGVDDTLIKGQTQKLMGKQVLNYVRTRYGLEDSTNNTRMIRQRQYIKALYETTRECIKNDNKFVANASIKMSEYIVSDCSANKLEAIFKKISSHEFLNIYDIKGESVKGEKFMEFYPDSDSLEKLVIDVFYKEK